MRPDSIDSLQPYLRHSFASPALALGESLPMIGRLLGHSQVQTTARYAHLARDSLHEAARRVSGRIEAGLYRDCPEFAAVRRDTIWHEPAGKWHR